MELQRETYPSGFTKSQKFALRSCKNFKLIKGELYYKDQNRDGADFDRFVLKRNVTDRVFLECHLIAGGHKWRDATIGKVKVILLAKLLQKLRKRYI